MFSGATRPAVTPSGDEHEGQVERGLHPGRDDAGADRAHPALEAVEGEAGPGGLFPPVDEREGDDRAEDGADAMDGSEARATTGAAPARTKAVARAAPGSATNATTYQRGLTRNRNTRLRSSRTPLRPSARAVVTKAAIDEGHRGQEDERGGAGQVEVDDPDAGVGQEGDGEDRRGRRVDDREERADGVASGEGAHGWGLDLWCLAAARVSRDGHTVRPRPLPSRPSRVSIVTGFCSARRWHRPIPGYRSGPSLRRMPRTLGAATVRTTMDTPSPGRAPPSPPARSSSTRRSPCSCSRSRCWPTSAPRRTSVRSSGVTLAFLLLENLPAHRAPPLPARRCWASSRARRSSSSASSPAGSHRPPGWASSSPSTPSASASTAGRRSRPRR